MGDWNSPERAGEVDTPGIVILTHGKAGEELIRSARMIAGDTEKVVAVSLEDGEDPGKYFERVSEVLGVMPGDTIVMTDLFGGTPSNVAAALSRDYSIWVISGVNLPMLIEAVNLRASLKGKDLVKAIESAGKDGIKNVLDVLGEKTT